MRITVSREIRIKDAYKPFLDTVSIYQGAVSFLIDVAEEHYDEIKELPSLKAMTAMERLVHSTSRREAAYLSFDMRFPKFPSYLRRSAIMDAISAVSLYRKNLSDWEASDKSKKKPRLNRKRNAMPAFYRGNMFILDDDNGIYKAKLKLWKDSDWKWHEFSLSQADIRNIEKEFSLTEAACPVLKKHGKRFSLSFAFEIESKLSEKKNGYSICAVDIGVNNAAVCSIIRSDGTVTGRRFIAFPGEEDRLKRILNERRAAHSASKCRTHRLDRFIENHNENLSRITAAAIAEYASSEGASVIVMEHLNPGGRARGSKKERLHLWRKRDVIKRTEALAHKRSMRFSTVYVPGTSQYAFDGSGRVARDKDNHSLCTFKTGKRYNADLSASYNIGGRYLIRELLKACPETEASEARAKVPWLSARATCTLSTYISLVAVTAMA